MTATATGADRCCRAVVTEHHSSCGRRGEGCGREVDQRASYRLAAENHTRGSIYRSRLELHRSWRAAEADNAYFSRAKSGVVDSPGGRRRVPVVFRQNGVVMSVNEALHTAPGRTATPIPHREYAVIWVRGVGYHIRPKDYALRERVLVQERLIYVAGHRISNDIRVIDRSGLNPDTACLDGGGVAVAKKRIGDSETANWRTSRAIYRQDASNGGVVDLDVINVHVHDDLPADHQPYRADR